MVAQLTRGRHSLAKGVEIFDSHARSFRSEGEFNPPRFRKHMILLVILSGAGLGTRIACFGSKSPALGPSLKFGDNRNLSMRPLGAHKRGHDEQARSR